MLEAPDLVASILSCPTLSLFRNGVRLGPCRQNRRPWRHSSAEIKQAKLVQEQDVIRELAASAKVEPEAVCHCKGLWCFHQLSFQGSQTAVAIGCQTSQAVSKWQAAYRSQVTMSCKAIRRSPECVTLLRFALAMPSFTATGDRYPDLAKQHHGVRVLDQVVGRLSLECSQRHAKEASTGVQRWKSSTLAATSSRFALMGIGTADVTS